MCLIWSPVSATHLKLSLNDLLIQPVSNFQIYIHPLPWVGPQLNHLEKIKCAFPVIDRQPQSTETFEITLKNKDIDLKRCEDITIQIVFRAKFHAFILVSRWTHIRTCVIIWVSLLRCWPCWNCCACVIDESYEGVFPLWSPDSVTEKKKSHNLKHLKRI